MSAFTLSACVPSSNSSKKCKKCGRSKPIADFISGRWHKHECHYCSHCRMIRTASALAWAARNPEKVRANNKRNDWGRKEKFNATLHGWASKLVYSAKTRAEKCGLPFSITVDDVKPALDRGACQRTGIAFEFRRNRKRSPWVPTIDRINPALGYVPDNIQVVAWSYNAAKGCGTDGDVMRLAIALTSQK